MSEPRRIGGTSAMTKPTDQSIKIGDRFYESDTGDIYTYDGDSWIQASPEKPSLATLLAHERNAGTANQYGVGVDESTPTVVDVSVNETDVSSTVPALLFGVYVNTALSAHALPLKDGTGGSTIITIPASAAAGAHYNFPGLKFDTALIVDPDDLATGNITVAWRAQ